MPAVGKLVSRDDRAYTYLPESVDAFPEGAAFEAIPARNGLGEVRSRPLTGDRHALHRQERSGRCTDRCLISFTVPCVASRCSFPYCSFACWLLPERGRRGQVGVKVENLPNFDLRRFPPGFLLSYTPPTSS